MKPLRGPSSAAAAAALACAGSSGLLVHGALVPSNSLPLRTRGRYIVDTVGRRVRLACVNWYGAHMSQMVVSGLDAQSIDEIASMIVEQGFNCVRLPFSSELALGNTTAVPDADDTLRANPALRGLTALSVFDATVETLTRAGLLVILNNHVSSAQWCCSRFDGEGLWYTDAYPEDSWLEALAVMAARYRGDDRVVGMDLRNELRQSWLTFPTFGSGSPSTDWAMAAAKGGRRVLHEDPDLLVIVSGLNSGADLTGVRERPLHVTEPDLQGKVVYTTHFYRVWSFSHTCQLFVSTYRPLFSITAACLCCLAAVDEYLHQRHRSVSKLRSCLPSEAISKNGCREIVLATVLCGLLPTFIVLGSVLSGQCTFVYAFSGPTFASLSIHIGPLVLLLWVHLLAVYGFALGLDTALAPLRSSVDASHLELVAPPGRPPRSVSFSSCGRQSGTSGGRSNRSNCSSTEESEQEEGMEMSRAIPAVFAFLSPALAQPLRERRRMACAVACCFVAWLWTCTDRFTSYSAMQGELDACWGYLLQPAGSAEHGDASDVAGEEEASASVAPVWIGEFGTNSPDDWWDHFLAYIREREVDWSYWAVNGEKSRHEEETYGLLQADWKTVRHAWKLEALQQLSVSSGIEE